MYKFNILLSCMYEKNFEIIEKSNINSSAIIINQCDKNGIVEIPNKSGIIKWINSNDRGLSKSRNLAIANSEADICLLADNDEVFDNDLEEKILAAYEELTDADIIIFKLHNKNSKLKNKIYRLCRMEMQRVCSWQISFKRMSILKKKVMFDELLGAGTGNGAGEENKFLVDCYDSGLKIFYYPISIANMVENESTWFSGFDAEYFYKFGMVSRYIWGLGISIIYSLYYSVTKYKLYKGKVSFLLATKSMLRGIIDNRLGIKKRQNF